jgi:hypothetical protein
MRPVTSYVPQVQYAAETTYRPVYSTCYAPTTCCSPCATKLVTAPACAPTCCPATGTAVPTTQPDAGAPALPAGPIPAPAPANGVPQTFRDSSRARPAPAPARLPDRTTSLPRESFRPVSVPTQTAAATSSPARSTSGNEGWRAAKR